MRWSMLQVVVAEILVRCRDTWDIFLLLWRCEEDRRAGGKGMTVGDKGGGCLVVKGIGVMEGMLTSFKTRLTGRQSPKGG